MESDGGSCWRGHIHHDVSRPGVGEIYIHIHVSQGQSTREGDGVDGRRQGVGNRCSRRTGSRIGTCRNCNIAAIDRTIAITVRTGGLVDITDIVDSVSIEIRVATVTQSVTVGIGTVGSWVV